MLEFGAIYRLKKIYLGISGRYNSYSFDIYYLCENLLNTLQPAVEIHAHT